MMAISERAATSLVVRSLKHPFPAAIGLNPWKWEYKLRVQARFNRVQASWSHL
jgi:hypothetical protein